MFGKVLSTSEMPTEISLTRSPNISYNVLLAQNDSNPNILYPLYTKENGASF